MSSVLPSSDALSQKNLKQGLEIAMIWAQAANGVIGADGDMPWYVPEDFAHFKEQTIGSPVIMGRTTWESLPEKSRPLPGRKNIVLSHNKEFQASGALVVGSAQDALNAAQEPGENGDSSTIWIIGGGTIYRLFMDYAQKLEVTDINLEAQGDTLAPEIPQEFTAVARTPKTGWLSSRTGIQYSFTTYERKGESS